MDGNADFALHKNDDDDVLSKQKQSSSSSSSSSCWWWGYAVDRRLHGSSPVLLFVAMTMYSLDVLTFCLQCLAITCGFWAGGVVLDIPFDVIRLVVLFLLLFFFGYNLVLRRKDPTTTTTSATTMITTEIQMHPFRNLARVLGYVVTIRLTSRFFVYGAWPGIFTILMLIVFSVQLVALLLDFYIFVHWIMTTTNRTIIHATSQDSQDNATGGTIAGNTSGDGLLSPEPNNNTDQQQQQQQQQQYERQRKNAWHSYGAFLIVEGYLLVGAYFNYKEYYQ